MNWALKGYNTVWILLQISFVNSSALSLWYWTVCKSSRFSSAMQREWWDSKEGRRISRRNEESGSKARPRGRKAAGPVVEERGAGEQADKYFSLDAKKYFSSTREIFSRSRPYILQRPLWQGRSQTLRPGIVDILQTGKHFSSSFHSGIVVTTQYFGIMFKTCQWISKLCDQPIVKNTIRVGGSTGLYAVYTVDNVDMVYTVEMV